MKLNANTYRWLLVCTMIAILSFANKAQVKPESIDNLGAPVKENTKTTYSDLINLVFPETESGARKSVPLNNIFDDYKGKVYEGNFEIRHAQKVWVNVDNRKYLLLFINLGDESREGLFTWGEMNVLALFDVEKSPRLIDAVDVQGDRFAFFSEQQPILAISPATDAFLIANHHFNSGDSYMILTLISVVNNRFKIVLGEIPNLTGDNHCGLNYDEKAFLKLSPNRQNAYRNITVNVKHIRNPDGAECERKVRGYTKNSWYRFAWSAKRAKYVKVK